MKFGVEVPFVTHLGFELVLFEGGQSQIDFDIRPEHMNSFAVAHGGVVMTLLDVTMAVAARSVQKDMGVVTIEMKTTFMRPGRGKLAGKGRLIHRTPTMAFVDAMVYNSDDEVCAHGTGTFKYVKRLPVGAKSVHPLNVISTD